MFNLLKTAVLMAAITALFMAVGGFIGGQQGMAVALVIALGLNFFSYWFSDKLVLKMYNAREVDATSAPQFYSHGARAGDQGRPADAAGLPSSTSPRPTPSPPGATLSTRRSLPPPASCAC